MLFFFVFGVFFFFSVCFLNLFVLLNVLNNIIYITVEQIPTLSSQIEVRIDMLTEGIL